jgi:transposase
MAWRRGQALSEDLRCRVLAAIDRGMNVYEAAPLFAVSVSYIYKALIRRRATGEATARPQCSHRPRKLAPYQAALRERAVACPDATIDDMRDWLLETQGGSSSAGGMWNTLTRLGLTHKKSRSTRPSSSARMWPQPALPGGSGRPA